MDTNDLRVVITVTLFLAFLGIIFWAYSSRQKPRFDEAANLPFADDEMQQRTIEAGNDKTDQKSKTQTSSTRPEGMTNG